MDIARRVKKWMSWDEYKSLDKNNRVMPDGEVVPVRDKDGRELPDPVPLAPPVGWHVQPSMFDVMRQMIRGEHLRAYAEAQGAETFEEAQDFDVEDEIFPRSEFEGDFEPLEDLQQRRQASFRQRFIEEEENASYKAWRERVLQERDSGVLRSDAASVPAEPARPSSPRGKARPPQDADGEDE